MFVGLTLIFQNLIEKMILILRSRLQDTGSYIKNCVLDKWALWVSEAKKKDYIGILSQRSLRSTITCGYCANTTIVSFRKHFLFLIESVFVILIQWILAIIITTEFPTNSREIITHTNLLHAVFCDDPNFRW